MTDLITYDQFTMTYQIPSPNAQNDVTGVIEHWSFKMRRHILLRHFGF